MKNNRILKMHSWECSFWQKYLYISSAVVTLFWTCPTLVSVVTFGACILVNTELTAAKVLSDLATFSILQDPIYSLPELITMIMQTRVSVDRIQKFMLGEIPLVFGALSNIYGSKSYVPQSAWIQSGTIRANILFGKQINRDFYENVLEGCALHQDINMWSDGDLTLVEEKQRIQLARAVYSDSDIYFLDAHTGTHLFKMELLSDKTVVYATHQLEFLEAADLNLVMRAGKIVQSGGGYNDLISGPNSELIQQMAAHGEALNHIEAVQEYIQEDDSAGSRPCPNDQIKAVHENIQETILDWKRSKEEEAMTGRVKWSVYLTFITSAALIPIILLCHILFQVMQIGRNYWVSWARERAHGKICP